MPVDQAPLPPFSGPGVSCPKCGEVTVSVHWHALFGFEKPPVGKEWPCQPPYDPKCEHLCRICKTCGYGWIEATKNTPQDVVPLTGKRNRR